jgi:hypothetical protein
MCAAGHHATVGGALLYAADFQRRYPHRPGHDSENGNQPHRLKNTDARNPFDDRPTLRAHFNLATLVCPLAGKIDLGEQASRPDTQIWGTYYLWFGFRFNRVSNDRGMFKLGDRFTWTAPNSSQTDTFNVLTSPHDIFWPAQKNVQNSHPDRSTGVMSNAVVQDRPPGGDSVAGDAGVGNHTLAQWGRGGSSYPDLRGPVDGNYGYDDGSVDRYRGVEHEDPRMVKVPGWANGLGWPEPVYAQLPRAR